MWTSIAEIVRIVVKWVFSKDGYREWKERREKKVMLKRVEELENEYIKAIMENKISDADRILAELKRMRK